MLRRDMSMTTLVTSPSIATLPSGLQEPDPLATRLRVGIPAMFQRRSHGQPEHHADYRKPPFSRPRSVSLRFGQDTRRGLNRYRQCGSHQCTRSWQLFRSGLRFQRSNNQKRVDLYSRYRSHRDISQRVAEFGSGFCTRRSHCEVRGQLSTGQRFGDPGSAGAVSRHASQEWCF